MKPSVLVVIIAVFSLAFVSRAIGTVGDVRTQLAATEVENEDGAEQRPVDTGQEEPVQAAAEDTIEAATSTDAPHGTQPAVSHESAAMATAAMETDGQEAASSGGATPATEAAAALSIPPRNKPTGQLKLALLIKKRTAEIERRIAELDEREQVLEAVEARLNEKLAELEAARASLAETATRLDAASGEDIKALALMYANMKPQQAGQIFNAMEPTFAAGFLTQIRSESAAAILASMDAQKAYAVSVIIAGRNVEN